MYTQGFSNFDRRLTPVATTYAFVPFVFGYQTL